jgi:hypothetical protein
MYDVNPNPKPSRNAKVNKIYIGQRAGWGKKNYSSSLVLTALTTMGISKAHLTTASMMDGQTLVDTSKGCGPSIVYNSLKRSRFRSQISMLIKGLKFYKLFQCLLCIHVYPSFFFSAQK